MADYQPGDPVHVAGFGKGVVRETRNHGRYLVEVKGRAMEVASSQLSRLDRPPRAHATAGGGASLDSRQDTSGPSPTIMTLDLHGHTVEAALDALDTFLNDAILAGASEVHVIHGKSGGRVKAAVHRRLRELPSVRAFRIDASNQGVTIAVL